MKGTTFVTFVALTDNLIHFTISKDKSYTHRFRLFNKQREMNLLFLYLLDPDHSELGPKPET